MTDLYTYKGNVVNVYDGNSVMCNVDLGFSIIFKILLKLKNLTAPNIDSEAGLISRDALREKILGKEIYINAEKEKTGKYVVTLLLADEAYLTETNGDSSIDLKYVNINDWLIENKYAIENE